jgi:GNAT superfamily N-acetyltransferase
VCSDWPFGEFEPTERVEVVGEEATGDAVTVRRIRPDEWEEFREVRLRALEADPLAFGSTLPRERGFSDDEWKERTRRGASGAESATYIAAQRTGSFLGLVSIGQYQGEWHVWAMWLDPGWRGKGMGGRLFDEALAWFHTVAPHSALILDVNPRQEAAERLYARRGFRRTGHSEPLGHTPGETVVTMKLEP